MRNFFKLKNAVSIMFHRVKRVHFIGMGGAGMCGIAEILIYEGYYVTGSDILYNDAIHHLIRLGVKFFFGHHRNNVNHANVVVISSAIAVDNPEIIAAKEAGIPIVKRAEMLFEIMRYKYGIVVSGTHGKTTTTAMIANIYIEAGLDPTIVNGGRLKAKGVHAHFGCGRHFIAEVDESDGSFLHVHPTVEVITNIEADHIDKYQRNFNYLKAAFVSFLHNLPFYGYAAVCIDDPVIREVLPNIKRKVITYGFSKDADFLIFDYHQYVGISSFIVLRQLNNTELFVNLNIPGIHNALNATAAIAVATEEGIADESILKTILHFQGIERRFENLGYYALLPINGHMGKILFIEDYGHHPTELTVSIKTARIGWPEKRLVMAFQPHRFTRLRDLYDDFVGVLSSVDVLLILDVYSAGENPILGVDSKSLCHDISHYGKINPIFVSDIRMLSVVLFQCLRDKDLLLVQGAGTIGKCVRRLIIPS